MKGWPWSDSPEYRCLPSQRSLHVSGCSNELSCDLPCRVSSPPGRSPCYPRLRQSPRSQRRLVWPQLHLYDEPRNRCLEKPTEPIPLSAPATPLHPFHPVLLHSP